MKPQRHVVLASALFVMAGASIVSAQGAPRLPARGYLSDTGRPDGVAIVPPPPATGSPRDAADHEVYRQTRALRDTPRWALALGDIDLTPAGGASHFDCAVGAVLETPANPALFRLLERVLADARSVYLPVKDHYRRLRPLAGNDLPICEKRDPATVASFGYPSGHATISWAWGLVLAELEPDRAGPILRRAAAVGESRVVCGMHYPSDIEAGRMEGAAVVAAEHHSPEFLADLQAARAEIDARRAEGRKNPICTAEADALKTPAF